MRRTQSVMIVQSGVALREDFCSLLALRGFTFIDFCAASDALRAVKQRGFDLIILVSSRANPLDGLRAAQAIRQYDRGTALILIAAGGSEALAVEALRTGVTDYLNFPFSAEDLFASIDRCQIRPERPPADAASGLVDGDRLVGESASMAAIKAYVARVAPTDSNVLITGETGTGKELAAELLHNNSIRRHKPFICINCAAIPDSLVESELFGYEKGAFTGAHIQKEGKLKLADGGTVFFDEIGDMTPYAQAKILRAIESREIERLGGRSSVPLNVRIIAATNRDLERLAADGHFRPDLYFRLNVGRIHLPPLRDRKEDLPPLIRYWIDKFNLRFAASVEGFLDEATDFLLWYEWPGNVRELKNVLEAIFLNGPGRRVGIADLPEWLRSRLEAGQARPRSERDQLMYALLSSNWNKSKAAEKLHWSRMTLYRKMAKYEIAPREKKPSESERMAASSVTLVHAS